MTITAIDAIQLITGGFNRVMRRIAGISTNLPQTDLRSVPAVRDSIGNSRNRQFLVLVLGIVMARVGSWLLTGANDT